MDEDLNLPAGEGELYDGDMRQDVDCEDWFIKDGESFGINKESKLDSTVTNGLKVSNLLKATFLPIVAGLSKYF